MARATPPQITIYVEGDKKLQKQFQTFLNRGRNGQRIKVVMGGSNSRTVDKWKTARSQGRDALLLIDSEGACSAVVGQVPHGVRDLLTPADMETGSVHFMVQLFEAWYLVAPEVLERWCGRGFKKSKLPVPASEPPDAPGKALEAVEKARVVEGLQAATKECAPGKQFKPRHSKVPYAVEMLRYLDLKKIAGGSFHARLLLERLRNP